MAKELSLVSRMRFISVLVQCPQNFTNKSRFFTRVQTEWSKGLIMSRKAKVAGQV